MRWSWGMLATLLAWTLNAEEVPSVDEPPDQTPDGLVRVENSVFDLAYLKPGFDLSRYNQIQIRPISIAYKQTPHPLNPGQRVEKNYQHTDEQRRRVSRLFASAFNEAMTGDGRYKLTTETGPETVTVRIALAQLDIRVPTRKTLRNPVLTVDQAVEVTLVVELLDSLSGIPLARGRDTQTANPPSGSFRAGQPEELRYEVEQVFKDWTRTLREGFDRFSPTAAP